MNNLQAERERNFYGLLDFLKRLKGKRVRIYTTCLEHPIEGIFKYFSPFPPYLIVLELEDGKHRLLNWTRCVELEEL